MTHCFANSSVTFRTYGVNVQQLKGSYHRNATNRGSPLNSSRENATIQENTNGLFAKSRSTSVGSLNTSKSHEKDFCA